MNICRTVEYGNTSRSSKNILVLIQLGAVRKDLTDLLACGVMKLYNPNGVCYVSFGSGIHQMNLIATFATKLHTHRNEIPLDSTKHNVLMPGS